MYCIQMHFQRVALKLAALSPRLTLTHSLSLLLEVLGQNSQVLLFNSNFFYISHTRKGSHKKVNVQKFSTKPKVMLGIIRNWIRLRYRGWFHPPCSPFPFFYSHANAVSILPVSHTQDVSHIGASCFPSPLELQLQPGQLSVSLQLQLKSSALTLAWQHVCVCKEVEGVCPTHWQQFESQIEVEVGVRRNKGIIRLNNVRMLSEFELENKKRLVSLVKRNCIFKYNIYTYILYIFNSSLSALQIAIIKQLSFFIVNLFHA